MFRPFRPVSTYHQGDKFSVQDKCQGRGENMPTGRDIPSQEAPPRPSVLRDFTKRTTHSPIIHRPTNGLGTKWAARLQTLNINNDTEQPVDISGRKETGRIRKAVVPRRRKPTPLQTARWKAVQKAKRKGLPIRGIARELNIHRNTSRKYMDAESPPIARGRPTSTTS